MFIILFIYFAHLKTEIAILCKVLGLTTFPNGSKILNSLKSESSLLICKGTVLTKSVEAYNELARFSQERFFFDFRPCAFLCKEWFAVALLLLFLLFVFLIPFSLWFVKLFNLLLISKIVSYWLVERLFEEARIILQGNCHKGSKSRHSIKVHLGLTDYLRDIDVVLEGH